MNIIRDILSGALPVSEIPGFILWAIGRSLWLWIIVIVFGLVFLVR